MIRKEEIFEIIRQHPGATGYTIHTELLPRTWAIRTFGDNFWGELLAAFSSVNLGAIYIHIDTLETEGRIRGEWGMRVGEKARRRHYYVVGDHGK
jgi:DNA-binding PadR family transcriptional regulator